MALVNLPSWFRKRWVTAIVGVVVLVLEDRLGLSPEQAYSIVALLVSYIIGQSWTDTALVSQGVKKQ